MPFCHRSFTERASSWLVSVVHWVAGVRGETTKRLLAALKRLVFLPEEAPRGRLSVVEPGELAIVRWRVDQGVEALPVTRCVSGGWVPWVLFAMFCFVFYICGAAAPPRCNGALAQDTAALQARNLQEGRTLFELRHGRAPVSFDELVEVGLFETVPKDPWGESFMVDEDCVRSAGPDGVWSSEDDVVACRSAHQ